MYSINAWSYPIGNLNVIFKVGDVIKKDSECQTCTCEGEGNMNCQAFDCPALLCAADEVEAHKDDACCGYCAKDWVKVSIIPAANFTDL